MYEQRGAPAPLPHCGLPCVYVVEGMRCPTRGAGAPPSLRHKCVTSHLTRLLPTRGAGAPPSLRLPVAVGAPPILPDNEGRRRPSLIAAGLPVGDVLSDLLQRGAPAPLPHCGLRSVSGVAKTGSQRGAPAPLPHCGDFTGNPDVAERVATRGAGAPPSLRRVVVPSVPSRGRYNEGRRRPSLIAAFSPGGEPRRLRPATRGAGAPPSLRPSDFASFCAAAAQRGAPAPLPHCGRTSEAETLSGFGNEGRRRPSLIAASDVGGVSLGG